MGLLTDQLTSTGLYGYGRAEEMQRQSSHGDFSNPSTTERGPLDRVLLAC